jgi:hypothetical protein
MVFMVAIALEVFIVAVGHRDHAKRGTVQHGNPQKLAPLLHKLESTPKV